MANTKKLGRPTKKDAIPVSQLQALYTDGWTDQQVADFYGINQSTLNRWKKSHPDFCKSLKSWKEVADREVERSLYKRATGGQWGDKEYPPETVAAIFWLKNRKPKSWRDKQETDIKISGSVKWDVIGIKPNG